jgi:hypothetical protein
MPISFNYTTPNTGAVAEYHAVTGAYLDYTGQFVTAYVSSYLDADAKTAGKFSMYQQQIQLDGMPPDGQTVLAYAEAELIAPVPADAPASSFQNRYAFAGGTLVA